MSDRYFQDNFGICRNGKEGSEVLTNFIARITKEIIYHDGPRATTHLEIEGQMSPLISADDPDRQFKLDSGLMEPRKLPTITIPAADFASLSWVAEKWGMIPIIFPVANGERDLRTAIQLLSEPIKHHVYTHTGWTQIEGKPVYLTLSGGISAKGLDDKIAVALPQELRHFKLPDPVASRDAYLASIRLVNLGPKGVLWPMLMATYRACVRPTDFAVHLAGRTGTFKSELTSLFQSHYGEEMDARHLPASWSSTPNALEHLAYRAKDAIMALDDFVPTGTAWQVRQLQKNADQIIRAQGNQAGRSRLTDTTSMQTTYYPRGLIFSTGEDVPEGHSIRGRMMIVELAPGDIQPAKLTDAQANRHQYPQALAGWIQWLAAHPEMSTEHAKLARLFRDDHLNVGHTRTPPIMGELIATARLLSMYGREMGWLENVQANELFGKARKAILEVGERQREYLEAADPVVAFIETIRTMLQSNIAHAKTMNGGIPADAVRWGWTVHQKQGELASYTSNGPTLGYIDTEAGEFLFDQGSIQLIKKWSGGRLGITPQTLVKRLHEAGVIARQDAHRDRHTVRVRVDGHQRNLIALNIDDIQQNEARAD